ncbi:MAG: hybrid sensor histidine kinase/response regulator [Minisyncoccia bacterium]
MSPQDSCEEPGGAEEALLHESASPERVASALIDFSERRRMRDELERIKHEHARATKELRELNRNKDEFLATLAHELRNPLAPIRSAIEILNLRNPSGEIQWALDVIDRQMKQMSRLIDDLLDIARIIGSKLELHIERVELAEVLHVAFETSRPLIESAGQEFIVSEPQSPLYISGDLIRLAQIVSNLLNNASKYTPRGGTIWFTAMREGDSARIEVRDTGVGIAPEMLSRIFDLFTQGSPSQDARRGGLGIGLTIVKRLVEMHGGSITAESAGEGQGSTFCVRLPVVTDPSQWLYRPVYDRERAAPSSHLRVLIVDDNFDAATTLDAMLAMAGNTTLVAHDGRAAIALAAEFSPQVILLDLDLPVMNGWDAAREIRKLPASDAILLIAVTGFGQGADKVRSKEAGFNHHLVKPVDPAALLQLLASIERYGGTLPEHIFETA